MFNINRAVRHDVDRVHDRHQDVFELLRLGKEDVTTWAGALLKDTEFLILDEATSDLDSHLERQVQRAFEEMEPEYAIVKIKHRLSTVKNADRIQYG